MVRKLTQKYQLLLKNDNHPDPLFIMSCLIKICDHEKEQAEQCALIMHHKGSCDVYSGDWFDVTKTEEHLTNVGLIVERVEL
jgi:ATP-dependent Clp protease adaptor protein ClpS